MTSVILTTTIFCFAVGIAVLLYNPGRFTNQILSIASVLVAAWLGLVATVIESGASLASSREPMLLFWLRANAFLAAFFPWLVWLLKESLIAKEERRRAVIKRSLPWLAFGSILALLSATDSFIAYCVEANTTERGLSYVTYNVLSVCAYVGIVGQSYRQIKVQTGMRRVAMQFLVLNFGIACLLLVVLTSVGNIFHLSILKKISLFVFVGSYFLTAWAIALHRVYEARQMFCALAQRLTMVLLSVGLIFLGGESGAELYSNRVALFISIMTWSFAFFLADNRLGSVFGLNAHAATTNVRMKIIDLARGHPDTEDLVHAFKALLKSHGKTAPVLMRFHHDDPAAIGDLVMTEGTLAFRALGELGWATPESLEHRKSSAELAELHRFMSRHSLGLVVASPQGSSNPSLILGLGVKDNRWPYTYPEVERWQNVAELMDNILTHSRLVAQAALMAKIEYLALVSRGLAHDLKNLITPMSSFLVHTEGYFPPGSAAEEVRLAAKRATRIMSEYVREAWFFGNQLEPKFEQVAIGDIMAAVLQVTESHAKRREVKVEVELATDAPLVADAVLIQRLITNLVANALDASSAGSMVRIEASREPADRLRVRVSDRGSGIAPEHRELIFEPYFTTKVFGDDTRGFGLGLTICQRIAQLHEGAISVQSELNKGTTFAVDLPLRRFLPRAALPATGAGRAGGSLGVALA